MPEFQVRPTTPFIEFQKEDIEGSISARFEQMVEKYPDRLAVKDNNHALTYRELHEASDRVAQAILNQRGSGEEPVALLFEQGVEVITAILGAWKAGKFYVILDPMMAQKRNAFILGDAKAPLMVTDSHHLSLANDFEQVDVLNIDGLQTAGLPVIEKPEVSGNSRACLFYTSGSTGKPKAVLQNHRNLLFIAMNYTNGFHVSHEDRLALFYSPSVIATARVFMLALCNGCLLSSFNLKKEGFTDLAKWVREEEISLFISVASVFRNFSDTLREGDSFPNIRLIRLGGEPVLPRDVEAYKKYFPEECLLVNRLGGTETGDFCWNFMNKDVQIEGHAVPLGYPIEGQEILLLDEAGEEAGPGEMGEIAVRSAYLALEYWRRPDLTKAAFLPDPEGGDKRIYRTGDLGQLLPDGQLVHRGRKDHMVKVRGYRVELPEVEAALSGLDAVSEAVVIPRNDNGDNPYLAAYWIPASESPPTISVLRRSLADTLPDYMIPSSFVMIKKFPVAANGKINRRALPDPGSKRPILDTPFFAPQNPTEEEIAQIWSEVLGLDKVGVNDPFLELGGNSLQATQIISRVRDCFHVALPIQTLLDAPTVSEMAASILHHKSHPIGPDEMKRPLDNEKSPFTNRILIPPSASFIEFKKEDVEGSIPARFEQMVEKYPDRLAVKDKNRELTYRELNQEANRVAHAIFDQSEGGEEPVALIFDQGFQAITAIMGALKSGKPYVFLDPTLSSDRNELILTNSEARLVVSDASNFSKASSYNVLNAINIDEYPNTSPRSKKLPTVSPDSPACILYTSGSTGVPKGVILNHRSQLATARNYTNCFHLSYEDRLCFLYSPSVSAAIRIILLGLCNGAALCVFDLKTEGFAKLGDWLRKEKISRYFSVGSVFRHFTSMLNEEDQFPDVRLVRLGGEPTLPKDVESYKRHFPKNCLFVNRIGGTETGTYSWYCMNQETQVDGNTVPVGYPMEGYEVFLLDEDGNEVEEGQIGEIVLKSRYLASGFWKRPDLTEASFSPASDGGEERIYRTGDLGRRLPDGCLVHMGRKDHQVKIRGYRIEVAEIEKVLLNLGTVKDTVVMPWKGKDGEQHLVAYFVPAAEGSPSISELREELAQKLPGYMVPSYFVKMGEFPRAANGKINRGALPEPGSQRPALSTPFVAPRNPIEKKVADVWSEVLGLDEVGVNDPFLELGGNSLRATQVLSRILDGFDVELQMNTLMQAPSVGSMAELIMHQIVNKGGPEKENLESDRAISPKKEGTSHALSFGQERLWFLDQLGQTGSAYHVSHAFRMEGSINRSALTKALQAIVARHDTIRTTFRMEGEKPIQVVDPGRTIELEEVDLRESRESTSEEELQRLLRLETDRPFDLSQDLMLRATLYRLKDDVHVLLLVMHHIASDGWSTGILYRELSEFYSAHVTGRPADLPELPIQYADYADWQRDWLESEKLDEQLAYWKERLAGSPAILELPTDRPRPPRQTFRGARERGFLSEELTAALKSLSRRERCTLVMTLLAAFQTLLYRCTGQDDIVVGSPIAGRTRLEVEKLIGIFLNTLALRSDLSGNPSFSELLKRVRNVTLGAYENQDIPFEKLLEELKPPRDLSRTPLFQVFFNMMNFSNLGIEMPGLMVEEISFSERPSKFDLTLYLKEQDGGIHLDWVYNPDLFDADTIRRFQTHYQTLLEEVIRVPDQPISTIPILTDADRDQLLVEWNDTQADFPAVCIHELFEAQSEKTPDGVAAIFEEEEITYGELNQRANQLAHYLQGLGIQAEDRVGIFMERSLEMVIGVLGILKAGGAYVPMDPIYPPERIAFMLEDSQASVLLTQSGMAEQLPESEARVICLDSEWEKVAGENPDNPNTETTPESLAYLIYTSGSTGTPKGVLGVHRATINRFSWMWKKFPFEKGEVTSQRAPLNVVAAVWEIFGPMLQGVPIVIIPDDVVKDPHRLINTLASQRVTRLIVVPSLLRALLDSEPSLGSALPNLRYCSTSGEELPLSVARQFVESVPHAKLLNLYGPTELASDVTCFEFPQNERLTSVPIGRPIANTQAYILDKNLELAPIGVPGELHFGGAGLARGYHQRPELTAEKFIPDPFAAVPNARLYKTGDLARYLPNGDIAFLGRTDYQVKVRGFRIELGEIESVLEQHEAINAVAVTEFEIAPGENSLVAYVAPNSGCSPSVDTLHPYLAQRLPRYMIPARFVFLESLPLNPYGKVDRKALPKPDRSRPEFEKTFVAPRTEVEKDLAEIWSEILKVDQVGIHDDFFELGGHSLMATRIIARIRSQIGVAIPLVSIFESSTVAEMAEAILKHKTHHIEPEELERLLDKVETSSE